MTTATDAEILLNNSAFTSMNAAIGPAAMVTNPKIEMKLDNAADFDSLDLCKTFSQSCDLTATQTAKGASDGNMYVSILVLEQLKKRNSVKDQVRRYSRNRFLAFVLSENPSSVVGFLLRPDFRMEKQAGGKSSVHGAKPYPITGK